MFFRLKNRYYGNDDLHHRIAEFHFLGRRVYTCEVISGAGRPTIELVAAHAEIEPATEQEWKQRLALAVKFHAEEQAEEQKRSDSKAYGVATSDGRMIVRVSPTRYTDDRGTKWKRETRMVGGVEIRVTAWRIGETYSSRGRSCLSDEDVKAVEAACGGAASYDFIKEGKKLSSGDPLFAKAAKKASLFDQDKA
jgi:hypothetical protein